MKPFFEKIGETSLSKMADARWAEDGREGQNYERKTAPPCHVRKCKKYLSVHRDIQEIITFPDTVVMYQHGKKECT